jgi:hypothetical protein
MKSSRGAQSREPKIRVLGRFPCHERARIIGVPEYLAPGVYVEETSYRSKSIEGVRTSTRGFLGSIGRGVDTTSRAVAVAVLGVLLGAVVSIALDKARRRRRRGPPSAP